VVRRLIVLAVVLAVVGFGAFWLLTIPRSVSAGDLVPHKADLANGERMFWAGGCESCHAAQGATGDDQLKLGGGQALVTPFGTFHVPNISPDPDHGIGKWTSADFVAAMKFGVAPGGVHLYPAFPYTSYQRMRVEDIIDLKAFLDTLPKVATPSLPHELPFPFNIRRGLGLWKLLYVDGRVFEPDPAASEKVNHGAYLVEGPGHCGECHTPRNLIGGPKSGSEFAGGPAPEGTGRIPNITPGALKWSEEEIATFLENGLTPDFDSAGGAMVPVIRNLAKLTADDRLAIAAYLKTVPAIEPPPRPSSR
jgi:mono/diheme cytochrome c family protein